jgi:hypothetical protein
MTEQNSTLLDALDNARIGHAPIADILLAGKAAKRRQQRVRIVGVAAAVLLIAGGGAIATQAHTAMDQDRDGNSLVANEDNPRDPAVDENTRQVGIGTAYISVPEEWGSNDASCNIPVRDTYYFPFPQACVAGATPRVSSVAIATGEFPEAGIRLDGLEPAGNIDGHQIVQNTAVCELSDPGACTQIFGIPDLDAYFRVTVWSDEGGEAVVQTIRDSLTLLTSDQTMVPFIPHGKEAEVVAALEGARLTVEFERTTCPAMADCIGGVTGLEPSVGTVIPVGSTVTVTVLE